MLYRGKTAADSDNLKDNKVSAALRLSKGLVVAWLSLIVRDTLKTSWTVVFEICKKSYQQVLNTLLKLQLRGLSKVVNRSLLEDDH